MTVLAAVFGLTAGAGSRAEDFNAVSSFEQDGLRVEMAISPLADGKQPLHESEDVKLRFRVREAGEKGNLISGLFPMSWMVGRDTGEAAPDRDECEYEIRSLLAGRLAHTADVNLNEYLLITLDDNNSVSIIDPQIESSKTKTLGMVALTSKGEDFVLAPDRRNVLVTLPGQGRVAAANIFKRKARYLDPGGQPRQIELQPDLQLAWIGDAKHDKVHAINAGTFELLGSISVGPGPHEMAFRDNSRELYVVSPETSKLNIIDTQGLEVKGQVEIGTGAFSVGYSDYSGNIYAAYGDGTVKVVSREREELIHTITLGSEISAFAVSPDGRIGFGLHEDERRVSIIDLSSSKPTYRVRAKGSPRHIGFTDTFAYIHYSDSGEAMLLDLGTLSRGKEPMVSYVVMGRKPPASGKHDTIAPIIAPLPEGAGALVMNAADRSVYHYMEGMNNPMGSYRSYPWTARGILISDRTIREVEKGIYQTEFRLPGAGTYTLPFLVPGSPQLHGCFTVQVDRKGAGRIVDNQFTLEPVDADRTYTAGISQTLRVRLTDADSGEPVNNLEDLMILVMRGPRWSWRGVAEPVDNGYYEIDVTFPGKGQYMIMSSSRSGKVRYGQLKTFSVRVDEKIGQSTNVDMRKGKDSDS